MRKRQGKKPGKMKDLPIKAKRSEASVKGGRITNPKPKLIASRKGAKGAMERQI
jgi:hypothetical protein